jgi:hypothetical protein
MDPHVLDFIRDHLQTLPVLTKFALGMVMGLAMHCRPHVSVREFRMKMCQDGNGAQGFR